MTILSYQCDNKIFQINFPNHHQSHEWRNGRPPADALTVHPRMLSMFRATAVAGSVLINLSSFYYLKDNEIKIVPETTLNMTDYIPVTLNHVRLVLLGYNMDTQAHEVVSGVSSFFSATTPPALPTGIPDNFLPSALIRLRYSITELSDLDITDARMVLTGGASGATGGVSKLVGLGGTPDPVLSAGADGDLTAIQNLIIANPDAGLMWDSGGYYAYAKGVGLGSSPSRLEMHIEPPTDGTASVYVQAGSFAAGASIIATNVDGDASSDEVAAYIGNDKQFSVTNGGIALTDGHKVNLISDDPTLMLAQHEALVTEYAVKSYMDANAWRLTNVWIVGSSPFADFSTIQAAIADSSVGPGDTIVLDGDITTSSVINLDKSITITTLGSQTVVLTSSVANSPAIYVSAANCTLRNFSIVHTGAGTTSGAVAYNADNLVIDNMKLYKSSGAASESYGIWGFGGSARIVNGSQILALSGSIPYGIYNSTGATEITIEAGVFIYGGYLDIYGIHGSSILYLKMPSTAASMGISWAGTINGWSIDNTGTLVSHDSISGVKLVNKVDEFSTDGTMAGDSDSALPTEKAVVTYVASKICNGVNRTVGAGKDHATIQSAIDWFAGKQCYNCSITVDAGTYSEYLNFSSGLLTRYFSDLQVIGDTRDFAGMTYVHGQTCNRNGFANLGSGTMSLSSGGNVIGFTGSVSSPDFTAAGVVVGDKVLVRTTAGTFTEYSITAVYTNSVQIGANPTINNFGGAVTFLPNRRVQPPSTQTSSIAYFNKAKAAISGFDLLCTSSSYAPVQGQVGSEIGLARLTARNGLSIMIDTDSVLHNSNMPFTAANCTYGIIIQQGARAFISYSSVVLGNGGGSGYLAQFGGMVDTYGGIACGFSIGYNSQLHSLVKADSSGATKCTYGYQAAYNSYLYATGTQANTNSKGNTVDYTPASSDTEGNVSGIITRS